MSPMLSEAIVLDHGAKLQFERERQEGSEGTRLIEKEVKLSLIKGHADAWHALLT